MKFESRVCKHLTVFHLLFSEFLLHNCIRKELHCCCGFLVCVVMGLVSVEKKMNHVRFTCDFFLKMDGGSFILSVDEVLTKLLLEELEGVFDWKV